MGISRSTDWEPCFAITPVIFKGKIYWFKKIWRRQNAYLSVGDGWIVTDYYLPYEPVVKSMSSVGSGKICEILKDSQITEATKPIDDQVHGPFGYCDEDYTLEIALCSILIVFILTSIVAFIDY